MVAMATIRLAGRAPGAPGAPPGAASRVAEMVGLPTIGSRRVLVGSIIDRACTGRRGARVELRLRARALRMGPSRWRHPASDARSLATSSASDGDHERATVTVTTTRGHAEGSRPTPPALRGDRNRDLGDVSRRDRSVLRAIACSLQPIDAGSRAARRLQYVSSCVLFTFFHSSCLQP